MSRRTVKLVLLGMITLDVIFPLVIFLSPSTWTHLIYGLPADDPLGLLHRMGGGWAAFALWMGVAYVCWERDPGWLMVVAGIRWTESWADWVAWAYADQTTLFGTVSLLAASPINVLLGFFYYRAYLHYSREPRVDAPPS